MTAIVLMEEFAREEAVELERLEQRCSPHQDTLFRRMSQGLGFLFGQHRKS